MSMLLEIYGVDKMLRRRRDILLFKIRKLMPFKKLHDKRSNLTITTTSIRTISPLNDALGDTQHTFKQSLETQKDIHEALSTTTTPAEFKTQQLAQDIPKPVTTAIDQEQKARPSNNSKATATTIMSSSTDQALQKILHQLSSSSPTSPETQKLLRQAKHALLSLNALLPTEKTTPQHLSLARSTLEAGALLSIRAQKADEFTRYWQQLQSFYELPASRYPRDQASGQKNKVTGLYLMLLLTKNDYAGFHTVLEGLEMESALRASEGGGSDRTASSTKGGKSSQRRDSLGRAVLEGDMFLKYPVMLEQWLMEGAYDRVWAAVKKDGVPSEEFAVFSEILQVTIRNEIADCSEQAYDFVPISSAKTLFFLESEGAVIQFANHRGWEARDGRITFPEKPGEENAKVERDIVKASGVMIENAIGYARELETIV